MEEFRVEASRGAWSVRRGVLIPLKEVFAEGAVAKKFFLCQVMEGVLTPTNSLMNTTLTESVIS